MIIIVGYFVTRKYIKPRIEKSVQQSLLDDGSLKTAHNSVNVILSVILVALICIVWGFDFNELLVISTGIITITGVALFASWSLLSNITAYFLLLAHQSFKQGNFIRIIEADNYIEGYISEINLFNTKLLSEEKEIIIYPNNLLISRPSIINPENRYSVIGKTAEFVGSDSNTKT